jgi:hypothetical protein
MPKKGQSEPLSWFASSEDCLRGEERLWQQLATLDAEQSTRAWMPSTNLVERKNLVDIHPVRQAVFMAYKPAVAVLL